MPRRTNEYQELVLLIEKALLPEGATITESAMVASTDGTTEREIDILVESPIGPHRIRIAIEAKKESRKMDLDRFDAIVGKYLVDGGVRVNKVVVVAHKGFTEATIARAKLLDIELVTLSEVKSIDWSRLKPPELCLRSAVELVETTFDDAVLAAFGGEIPNDAQVVCSCGWRHGDPKSYATFLFWRNVLRDRKAELANYDDEVVGSGAERKLLITVHPGEPHQTWLEHGGTRATIREFSFKVRLFQGPPPPQTVKGSLSFSHAPHLCKVSFTPEIAGVDGKTLLDESRLVCTCCGKDHGTVRQWTTDRAISRFLNQNTEAQKVLSDGLQKSPTGHAHLIVSFPVPSKFRVVLNGIEHAPTTVKVDIHAVSAKGEMRHEQFEMYRSDGTASVVDSFDGIVGGKRLRMILPQGRSSKKIVLRLDDSQSKAKKGTKKGDLLARRKRIDRRKKPGA